MICFKQVFRNTKTNKNNKILKNSVCTKIRQTELFQAGAQKYKKTAKSLRFLKLCMQTKRRKNRSVFKQVLRNTKNKKEQLD